MCSLGQLLTVPNEIEGIRKELKEQSQLLREEVRARKAGDEAAIVNSRETKDDLVSKMGELKRENGELMTAFLGLANIVEERNHQVETLQEALKISEATSGAKHKTLDEELAAAESRKPDRFVLRFAEIRVHE